MNRQWRVTKWGMDCRRPDPSYPIAASRLTELTERSGQTLYDWPVHLCEKEWVMMGYFLEAFEVALDEHAGNYDPPFDEEVYARTLKWLERQRTGYARRVA